MTEALNVLKIFYSPWRKSKLTMTWGCSSVLECCLAWVRPRVQYGKRIWILELSRVLWNPPLLYHFNPVNITLEPRWTTSCALNMPHTLLSLCPRSVLYLCTGILFIFQIVDQKPPPLWSWNDLCLLQTVLEVAYHWIKMAVVIVSHCGYCVHIFFLGFKPIFSLAFPFLWKQTVPWRK